MKFFIDYNEIKELLEAETPYFDKYISPLLNLANRFSQATRPQNVGKISELINQFKGRTLEDWTEWYLEHYPNAVKHASKKILDKIEEFKKALDKINPEIVEKWVQDLVIVRSYIGLHFQQAILKEIAEIKNLNYRLSLPEEEAKGIDGFIGNIPISIKPETYTLENANPEVINVIVIYYEKEKYGISFEIPDDL